MRVPQGFGESTSPPEVAVAYMDRCGVERAILVQEISEGFLNGFIADVVSRFPGRFVGEALLDPSRRESSDELEELLASGRLSGLKLPIASLQTIDPRFDLDAPVAQEWLDICDRHGAFVTIHPPKPELFAGAMRRAAERFPRVRFLIAHMGLPNHAVWGRVLDLCALPNVSMDLAAVPYLFHERCPCPKSQLVLKEAVQKVGAEKFLWGSDYPRTLTDLTYAQQIGWVREAQLFGEEEKAKMLGLNALRVIWGER